MDAASSTDGGAVVSRSSTFVSKTISIPIIVWLFTPLVYVLVAFHRVDARFLAVGVPQHVAFNTVANAVVMLGALGLSGRFDEKLSGVFRRVLVVHGALAFFTLITRHYYSIPMLLSGGVVSTILGVGVVIIRQKAVRPRVGILGPAHWIIGDPWIKCEILPNPAAPVTPYDFLLLTFDGATPPKWSGLLSRALLAGKRVRHVAEYIEDVRGVTAIEHFAVDHLSDGRFASYRIGKRVLDVVCTLAALPFAALLLAPTILGIWLTMGRPVLFIQPRIGEGGRVFRMAKLRTMRASQGGLSLATARDDDRITRVGRWLRRFRIDELPQLWNVLSGDMSLIGPRPEQPDLAADYAKQTPAFVYRQLIRPGITGWAQVRAPYAADLAETRVKLGYDLFYLKHLSLGLDAQIVIRTIWTLLSGGGVR